MNELLDLAERGLAAIGERSDVVAFAGLWIRAKRSHERMLAVHGSQAEGLARMTTDRALARVRDVVEAMEERNAKRREDGA